MMRVTFLILLLVQFGHQDDLQAHPLRFFNPMHAYMSQFEMEDEPFRSETEDYPVVTVPGLGTATGMYLESFFQRTFSSFRGIPFAEQPERFQYPFLYNTTWPDEELDATYFRPRCVQNLGGVSGSEDCLHLNVYSPITNFSSSPLPSYPVMVFIYGGAYVTGESTYYIPTKLLDKDVLVVTINYRLGTLGFLYSGTVDSPGNMGLMDQVTALRWVQRHISAFGGDPECVTVFGQSAGGASTSWMQITPLTKGDQPENNGKDLAHRFIPMSGSAFEYWTLEHDAQNSFLRHVNETGCATEGQTNHQMMECMKELSLEQIVSSAGAVAKKDLYEGGLGFIGQVPVVQSALINDPAAADLELVIVEEPVVSVKNGNFLHAPLMLGSTRDEGSLVIGIFYNGYMKPRGLENDPDFLRDDILKVATVAFGIKDDTNSVANIFRLAYMAEGVDMGVWDNIVGPMVDMGGMSFLKSGLWTLAHEISAHNNSESVFFYSFEHESVNTLFVWMFADHESLPVPGGVGHADDLMYLFGMPTYFEENDINMVKKMTTLYTNFAKWGNPTPSEVMDEAGQWPDFCPSWKPFNAKDKPFMLIKDDLTMEKDFVKRWNYNKYGYPHQDKNI